MDQAQEWRFIIIIMTRSSPAQDQWITGSACSLLLLRLLLCHGFVFGYSVLRPVMTLPRMFPPVFHQRKNDSDDAIDHGGTLYSRGLYGSL